MVTPGYRVAGGPIAGTDWCVLDNPPRDVLAPGGVVLCLAGTRTPSPDAARAADSARAVLRDWNERVV